MAGQDLESKIITSARSGSGAAFETPYSIPTGR